jgi:hypothetical protein
MFSFTVLLIEFSVVPVRGSFLCVCLLHQMQPACWSAKHDSYQYSFFNARPISGFFSL